jgi:glycosyltransferase involved in cell wall biosynthesis
MNIHYLSSSTVISDSANSVHVMKICNSFSGLGHNVTLHAYQGSGEDDILKAYYNVENDFKIIRHSFDEELGPIFRLIKKIIPKLPLGGIPALFFSRRSLRRQIIKSDLIVARNMYWLWGVRDKAPFIYETHAPPDNILKRYIEKNIITAPNCKGVVVISEKLAEIYRALFPHCRDKLIVSHDAADDPGDIALNLDEKLKRPLKNIGYVGHIYQGRGIEIILEMAKVHTHLTFHIVGGRADLIEDYQKQGVPDNVIFHGHHPQKKLIEFYKMFDAVLAPYQHKVSVYGNRGDTSAFMSPLKIFEYMSWGLPILCSDMPVLHEVLRDQENALLIEPDRADLWAQGLADLETNQALRETLSHSARQDFLDHYSWKKRAQSILQKVA